MSTECMLSRRRAVLAAALAPCAAWPTAQAAGDGRQALAVVGERHKLLLRADGSVLGWGAAQDGQFGPPAALPLREFRLAQPLALPLPGRAVAVAAGDRSSLLALEDGSVLAWGSGPLLGQAHFGGPAVAAQRVAGLESVVQLAAYRHSALALTRDGRVLAWGAGEEGQFGDGRLAPHGSHSSTPPQPVPGVSGVAQVSAGTGHVLALTREGRVLSWGSNSHGALGRGPRQEKPLDAPGEVEGLTDVVQVAAGNGVSAALTRDGRVWTWGANWHGQFGNGQRTDPPGMNHGFELRPQPVAGVAGVVALSLGLTGRHTLALLRDGSVRGWGNTDWGQLGAGVASTYQLKPVAARIQGVAAVFAAGNNSFAVKRDGSLWAWGDGRKSEWPLGAASAVPVAVALP